MATVTATHNAMMEEGEEGDIAVDTTDAVDADAAGVERHRDVIVDGEIFHVLDLCRRLLQAESYACRAATARLMVDRLRAGHAHDSADHVNALLRVLANYATPTKELTEELLALLFFMEHRVQLIHHLAKLTFQSRTCVQLVIDAYIELLASDQTLLVPILGSLAELPLQASDKTIIVEATECLLDAASEADVPAVVQSLLSMLAPSCALRVVAKIRNQCNRLVSRTLALTFEVIMRHAVAGSGALTAFLRVIRRAEPVTTFDLVFLAILLGKTAENAVGNRSVAVIALKGRLRRHTVHDTVATLSAQGWNDIYPSLLRLASSLLAGSVNATYRPSSFSSTIHCAIDLLGLLVSNRTASQEEALSFLFSLVGQPLRLLLSMSRGLSPRVASSMCWEIAQAAADQLAGIASTHPRAMSPFAHVFLDQLHSIVSATHLGSDTMAVAGDYPPHILDSLCKTMVILTRHEPGVMSLLMITIQKQLVAYAGVHSTFAESSMGHSAGIQQLKQLLAIFLAGHVIKEEVGDLIERRSMLQWILKLLSSPTSDTTLLHIVRLVSDDVRAPHSVGDKSACASLLNSVNQSKGFKTIGYGEVHTCTHARRGSLLAGLPAQKSSWLSASVAVDVLAFVKKIRLGIAPLGWSSANQSRHSVVHSLQTKIALLTELYRSFLLFSSDVTHDTLVDCGFVLAPAEEVLSSDVNVTASSQQMWCLVGALQIAVSSVNMIADDELSHQKNRLADVVRHRKHVLLRVQTCWELNQRLRTCLDQTQRRLNAAKESCESEDELHSLRWLELQIEILAGTASSSDSKGFSVTTPKPELVGLDGLSLQAVSSVLGGLWKQSSVTLDAGLEIELVRVFTVQIQSLPSLDSGFGIRLDSRSFLQSLLLSQDARRTLKYLTRRLLIFAELLTTTGGRGITDGDEVDEDDTDNGDRNDFVLAKRGVVVVANALRIIIHSCRRHGDPSQTATEWQDKAIELLARGAVEQGLRTDGATGCAVHCEILFRSVAHAAARTQDADVVCELVDVLLCIAVHTRMQAELSCLSLSLLHHPFPLGSAQQATNSDGAYRMPLLALTDAVVSPRGAGPCALVKFKAAAPKGSHVSFLLIGAWSIAPTVRLGLTHVMYVVGNMEMLVTAAKKGQGELPLKSVRRRNSRRQTRPEPESEADDLDSDDPLRWVARDGEHRVLKNLTNESFTWFLDAAFACSIASPLRALSTAGKGVTPFTDVILSLGAICRLMKLWCAAEFAGFSMPVRSSVSILRSGPFLSRTVEQVVVRCIELRHEEGQDDEVSPLSLLHDLLDAVHCLVLAMQQVADSFQERITLKMQQSMRIGAPKTTPATENLKKSKSSRRGWSSELLHKVYGASLQRRKPISQQEAKLLPYFSHAAEELKAFVSDQSGIYQLELTDESSLKTVESSMQSLQLDGEDVERIVGLLNAAAEPLRLDSIDQGELQNVWRLLTDDIQSANEDAGGDSSSGDEEDVELGTEDEDEEEDEQLPRLPQTKRARALMHSQAPAPSAQPKRRKRILGKE